MKAEQKGASYDIKAASSSEDNAGKQWESSGKAIQLNLTYSYR